jgi:hypothetical protein
MVSEDPPVIKRTNHCYDFVKALLVLVILYQFEDFLELKLFSAWAVFFSGILPTVASYDSSALFSYSIFAVVWLSSLLAAVPSVLVE